MVESDEIRARIAALVGSHTVVRDGQPVPVWQAVGAQNVEQIAATVHDDVVAPVDADRDRLRQELKRAENEHDEFLIELDFAFGLEDGEESRYSNPEGSAESIYIDVAAAYKAERDTARAALAAIRDRRRRHGDRCSSCERHRHQEPRLADTCDDPECRAEREQHPCEDYRTATAGLAESEDT